MKLLCDLSGLVIARYGDSPHFGPEPVAHDGQLLYTVPDSVLIPDAVVRVLVEDGKEPEFIADQSSIDYQWKGIKEHRNQLLKESDWICSVSDYCPPNKDQWVAYRQGLRDITAQPNPFRLVWPKEPSLSLSASEPVTLPASASASSDSQPATASVSASSDSQPASSDSQPASSDSQPASSDSVSAPSDPASESASEPASAPSADSTSASESASEPASAPSADSTSASESASEPASAPSADSTSASESVV